MASFESGCLPTRHCVPGDSTLSWPCMRETSKLAPIAVGASQSAGERVHNHAQSAYGLVGSCSTGVNSPQPHDQTDAMPVSAATCAAASACHFVTVYQAASGWSPLRPPKPLVVAK